MENEANFNNTQRRAEAAPSIVRKSQVVGFLVGAIGTGLLLIVAFGWLASMPPSQHGDDATAINSQEAFLMLISLPVILIAKLFHCESSLLINAHSVAGIVGIILVIAVNSIITCAIGYIIGRILAVIKKL